MSKKKILKKNPVVSSLKKLSFSDLHSMYVFVSSLNNATFGKRVQVKSLLRNKLAEIETELYNRTFGTNPFALEAEILPKELVDVKGQDPVKVIGSFTDPKTFVVAKNSEERG